MFKTLAAGTFMLALTALGSVHAIAEEGIDDPKRYEYYDTFKGKRVVFLPIAMGFDLTEGWAASLARQARDLGYTLDIRDPNWSTDAGAQALTQIIAEKPDVIVVHNPDIQVYARLFQRAQKEGIYVIQANMNSAYQTEAFVGPDWVAVGEQLAGLAVAACDPADGKSGKIAITQGPLTAAASAYQIRGVTNVLAQNPGIEVVSNQAANWDASTARGITATVLQQHPDLCAVIGFWDGQDVGSVAAVSEAGKLGDVFLATSSGGARMACDNVKEGKFDAVISYDVAGQGRDMNNLIKVLLQSKPAPGSVALDLITTTNVITPENVKASSCYDLEDIK